MLVLGTEAFGEIEGVGGVGAHGIGCICCDNLLLLDSSSMLSQWNGKKIMRKEECGDLLRSLRNLGFHQGVKHLILTDSTITTELARRNGRHYAINPIKRGANPNF
jgi:hypothetical protein